MISHWSLAALTNRFFRSVERTDSCWLWHGVIVDGYGRFTIGRRFERAHRVAYWFTHGDFDRRLLVCHRCDVRRCVNPAHLFLGTQSDNIRDCVAKGRHAHMWGARYGVEHRQAKLTIETLRALRADYAAGLNGPMLAAKYGIHERTARRAAYRESYRRND